MTGKISMALILGLGGVAAQAAFADTPNATSAPSTQKLVYEVFEVQGKVRVAPTGTDELKDEGWRLVKKGDELGAGQQIRTSFRSKVKLIARPADPPTVIMFENSTLVNISDLDMRNGAAFSRMQMAHGAIRAGVAEGSNRSDMEIATPAATLSKKGTDIFRYEYVNGRYNISLSDQGRGLLQTIQTQANNGNFLRTSYVTPGQFVTHLMTRAIDNMQFNRQINVNDMFGLGGSDQLFTMLNGTGFGILLPQGQFVGGLNTNTNTNLPINGPNNQQNNVVQQVVTNQVITSQLNKPTTHPNPFGNFGIGQGNLPSLVGANSAFIRSKGIVPPPARVSMGMFGKFR